MLDLPDQDELIVALDTETSGLFIDEGARLSVVTLAWYSEEFGDSEIETRCIPFDHGLLNKNVPGFQHDLFAENVNYDWGVWDELCAWLLRQKLVFHNAKFDLHMMAAGHREYGGGVDLSRRVLWDTQVVNPIFFPNEPTGLKPTSQRLWGEQERDTEKALMRWLNKHKVKDRWGDLQPRYDLAPWDLVAPYATEDAHKTIRLCAYQLNMLAQGDIQCPYSVIDQEIDLAICLFRMEQRGVAFDSEACLAAAAELRKAASKVELDLRKAWRRAVTPANAAWWFFQRPGSLDPIKLTETGRPSVDMEVVEELVRRKAPLAAEYQQLAQYRSALSKWYEKWPLQVGPDGRLRASFHQTKLSGTQEQGGRGTISGRLSVERIQLHAIPHDFRLPTTVPSVRSFFGAKEGHELWEIDISQAEVRVATHVAQCEAMWKVLTAGDDVHGATAVRVFGVDPTHPEWDMYRTLAKRLTFGTLYGFGVDTMRETIKATIGIDATRDQCQEWIDDYRRAFPEFRELYYRAQDSARRRGFVELVSGRRRWFSDFEMRFKTSKAFNQIIQGNVAEAMKRIKVEVEVNYPGVLVSEVHDSLLLELPAEQEGQAEAWAKMISDLMLTVLEEMFGGWDDEHRIPWRVDAKRWLDKS